MAKDHARASRRDLLVAAAGGASALVAKALTSPLPVAAASTAVMTETDNPTGVKTSISATFALDGGDELLVAIEGNADGDWVGVRGHAPGGAGVMGDSDDGIGVLGRLGDSGPNFGGRKAGVTGTSAIADSSGVLGSGIVGVQGDGDVGVRGFGRNGVVGVADGLGPPGLYGTGVYGYSGTGIEPTAPNNVGVYARGDGASTALRVQGKATFSRSGRTYVSAAHSSRTVTLAGVTTSSLVLVTLQTRRTGVYVAAATPGTGRFTVYLNKAVAGTTYFAYFVLN